LFNEEQIVNDFNVTAPSSGT